MHPYLMYELIKMRTAELESRAEHHRAAREASPARRRSRSRLRTVPGRIARPLMGRAHGKRGTGRPVPRPAGLGEPAGGPRRTGQRTVERDRVPAGK